MSEEERRRLATELREQLEADARGKLGDVFDAIKRRGNHRLAKMLLDVEATLEALVRPPARGNVLYLSSYSELVHHLDLLGVAKEELSTWPEVAKSCFDAEFYDHLVLTLATQRRIRMTWGAEVQAIPEAGNIRTPDLMAYRNGQPIFAIEVKSKRALIDATQDLIFAQAQKLMKAAIHDVGSSADGQLAGHIPSMLVVGGFYVTDRDFEVMRKAAADWFRRNPGRRKSMIGVMLLSSFVYPEKPVAETKVCPMDEMPKYQPATHIQMVFNPSHKSEFQFVSPPGAPPRRYPVGFDRWAPTAIMLPEGAPDAETLKAAMEQVKPRQPPPKGGSQRGKGKQG
jgi:hypothetical protein